MELLGGGSDPGSRGSRGAQELREVVEAVRLRDEPHDSQVRPLDLVVRQVVGGHQEDAHEANDLLEKLGIAETKASKVDLFLERKSGEDWLVFGAAHVKSSIAERIQDDVPASQAFMERGLLSIALTMDAKSYPPPHGNCVNYGELGGRSLGVEKERLKRNYVEVRRQFDGLFSFNLRTPPSPATTPSGNRIYTMLLHEEQPDQLVRFLLERRAAHANSIAT